MRHTRHPTDGIAITLDDLAEFVTEMRDVHDLPGDTPVRAAGVLEFDLVDGPRIARLTADPDADRAGPPAPPRPNRAARRGNPPRRPGRR